MKSPLFSERMSALRREIASAGLDGLLVPKTDEYQNEYVPPCAERIEFLSGFTGSAGSIVVLKDKAAFFTDGRYTLQAAKQVPKELFALFDVTDKLPAKWLEENAPKGSKIGYDPWLHSVDNVDLLRKALAKAEAKLVPAKKNLVDLVWKDKPAPPAAQVTSLDITYAGKESSEKRQEIAAALKKKNIGAAILTDPASVAWLLNVRGGDVAFTPLPLSRAIIHDDASVEWFVAAEKVPQALASQFGAQVAIHSPNNLPESLKRLSSKTVLLDAMRTPSAVMDMLRETQAKIERGEDPCALPRAIKNKTELSGMRAANERDSIAVINFLSWLDAHWKKDRITECAAERQLLAFRRRLPLFQCPSFATISGTGEHGAIVHYEATEETDATLSEGQLYLLDSGGQYLDGTTDVTRTIALGAPTIEMQQNFTRVLKGHIALASICFPQG
ncbi:MAG: aminopeptidase P family N-terminal domain-containing protein, partial [Alphaproteobacteria bacterium]|nr:aminopeptidase P family N-terminal domain-containing protein [Alphaproteobacteria bacterium]